MSLKTIAVIVLLLQALALPGAALAAPEPTRGVEQVLSGSLSPGNNFGICWYTQSNADGTYWFWLYWGFSAIFWTTNANDIATLASACAAGHYVQVYCPDAACEWTSVFTWPYGYFYNGGQGY